MCVRDKALSTNDDDRPHVALVDSKQENVDDPEETFEQSHVHVVVIPIISQASVSIFYQDKPGILS